MHFADEDNLYLLLLVVPPLLAWLIHLATRGARMRRMGFVATIKRMLARQSLTKAVVGRVLLFLALSLMALAAARPQFGGETRLRKRMGIDVALAVDLSKSMMASDIKPNRLKRAKLELSRLIERLRGNRLGIVGFAGEAFVQCPLTTDNAAALMFLRAMDPQSMPVGGTNLAVAIDEGTRLLEAAGRKGLRKASRVMVLLTDGEDHDNSPMEAAKRAKEAGIKILTVGIGSRSGEPIPILREDGTLGGYQKDSEGKFVTTRLDEELLKKVAAETGGEYFPATAGSLDKLLTHLDRMEKEELESRLYVQFEDRFQVFLYPALLLFLVALALGDRRGVVFGRRDGRRQP